MRAYIDYTQPYRFRQEVEFDLSDYDLVDADEEAIKEIIDKLFEIEDYGVIDECVLGCGDEHDVKLIYPID